MDLCNRTIKFVQVFKMLNLCAAALRVQRKEKGSRLCGSKNSCKMSR